MNKDAIYVLVLAWNHKEDTREVLYSVQASNYTNVRIAVINNGSTDGTEEMLSTEFPTVEVIRSEKNLGVSGGYNLGINYAMNTGADYILIANNDISVDPRMITNLYNGLIKISDAGIAMPKIFHYYGNRNRLWCTGAYWRKFPPTIKMRDYNKIDDANNNNIESIEFAPSCVLMLTSKLINKIGMFDTNYFFYFDDWDYSKRARSERFKIIYVPTATMWHKISESTQKSDKPYKWWEEMGWSAARYYSKYHTNFQRFLFFSWFVIRESLKGKPAHGIAFITGAKKYIQVKSNIKLA